LLVSKDWRVQPGADWQGHNLWHSSFRDASSLFNREFPNYGLTLAWPILLECLPRTQRKRISTRGWDLWLFLQLRWKSWLVRLLYSTLLTPYQRYASCNPKYFVLLLPLCVTCCWYSIWWILFQGHQFLTSRPPLPEEGPLNAEAAPAKFEAPEASDNQDGDEVKGSLVRRFSMVSPSLAESETQVVVHPIQRMHPERKLLLRVSALISSGCLTCKCSHSFSLSFIGSSFFPWSQFFSFF
jgi:hypothetical protein